MFLLNVGDMIKKSHILFVITFLKVALAAEYVYWTDFEQHNGNAEINECASVLRNNMTWDFKPLGKTYSAKAWDAICGYPPATGSLFLCTYGLSGSETELFQNFKHLVIDCQYSNFPNYTWEYYYNQYINATQYEVPLSELNTSSPLTVPTTPNLTLMRYDYEYYLGNQYNYDSGTWFSVGLVGFFALLFTISGIYNFLRVLGFTRSINKLGISKKFQKYIIFPTLFKNGKYTQPYGFKFFTILFPNRIQFIVDTLIFGLELGFFCSHYRNQTHPQWRRYVAKRAAVRAFGKFPLIVLFAGRNNFLIYITGWSYATFLHYHKILAGWMFVNALVHAVGYTIDYLGYYVSTCKETVWFPCGIAAMVFCGILLLHSLHIFRSYSYEIFVTLHTIFAICFFVLCWYHNNFGWMEWLVAAICVWFFDRFVRWIRMAFFGFKTANITVADDLLMKVEVSKPSWWIHTPGTHGYIYFANIIFWQCNPFTLTVQNDKLVAYIRVKRGVTRRIWNKLIKNNNCITWKVCIEGPYGGSNWMKMDRYNDTLLLAGGSGAPGIVECASMVRNGRLIWISQTLSLVTAYNSLLEHVKIPIDIYITQENSGNRVCTLEQLCSESESDNKSSEDSEKASNNEEHIDYVKQITIIYCKPDLEAIINTAINEANSDSVAILSCGPPRMTDHVRNIFTNEVDKWDKSVDLFDDFQTW